MDAIGQGGMGFVFRTRCVESDQEDVERGQLAAWKELQLKDGTPSTVSAELKRRFGREVRIQAQLRHPNIVPVFGWNMDASPPFFIMELCKRNLVQARPMIHSQGPTRRNEVFLDVLSGVSAAHKAGVIHRDLKPSNILLRSSGKAAITDFGLARMPDSDETTLTETGQALGTRAYMAPEQALDSKKVGVTADIYALGKILYFLVANRHPSEMDKGNWEGVSSGLKYVIQKATEHNASKRYQSVDDLRGEFELVTGDGSMFQDPSEVAAEIVASLRQEPESSRHLSGLLRILRLEEHNEALLMATVPEIPQRALAQMAETDLLWIVTAYDAALKGSLPFEYCDKVASFAQRVWSVSENARIRRITFARVLDLGYSHNRWLCQDVAVELAGRVRAHGVALSIRDEMTGNPRALRHYGDKFTDAKLLPILRSTVQSVMSSPPSRRDSEDISNLF
jgi:hypothetical protein